MGISHRFPPCKFRVTAAFALRRSTGWPVVALCGSAGSPLVALRGSARERLGHFEADRLADELLEGLEVPGRRPEFELGVARRMQADDDVLAAVADFEAGNRLRMAAVETFRDTQDRGERLDGPAQGTRQPGIFVM